MSLRSYLDNACEEIDASIFSGDVLYVKSERAELKRYVERWARAIAESELADDEDSETEGEEQ